MASDAVMVPITVPLCRVATCGTLVGMTSHANTLPRIPREGERVDCLCWCMRRVVLVRVEDIWKKRTETCGHPDCNAPD